MARPFTARSEGLHIYILQEGVNAPRIISSKAVQSGGGQEGKDLLFGSLECMVRLGLGEGANAANEGSELTLGELGESLCFSRALSELESKLAFRFLGVKPRMSSVNTTTARWWYIASTSSTDIVGSFNSILLFRDH
jgi:hypothetical protein